jgi:hypothetical protein
MATSTGQNRVFSADVAVFTVSNFTDEGFTTTPVDHPYSGIFQNARIETNYDIVEANAARDSLTNNLGFGRRVPNKRSWSINFTILNDLTLIAGNPLVLAFAIPGNTLTDNSAKGIGYVKVVFQRKLAAGVADGTYTGYGYFTNIDWNFDEGAQTISGTITGTGALVAS